MSADLITFGGVTGMVLGIAAAIAIDRSVRRHAGAVNPPLIYLVAFVWVGASGLIAGATLAQRLSQ